MAHPIHGFIIEHSKLGVFMGWHRSATTGDDIPYFSSTARRTSGKIFQYYYAAAKELEKIQEFPRWGGAYVHELWSLRDVAMDPDQEGYK